jgi:hypothetical protein
LAYVAVSRGRYDAQIYTNDKTQLAAALDRDVSHRAAIEPRAPASPAQTIERSPTRQHSIGFGIGSARRRPSPFDESTVLDGVQGALARSAAEPPLTSSARRADRALL